MIASGASKGGISVPMEQGFLSEETIMVEEPKKHFDIWRDFGFSYPVEILI